MVIGPGIQFCRKCLLLGQGEHLAVLGRQNCSSPKHSQPLSTPDRPRQPRQKLVQQRELREAVKSPDRALMRAQERCLAHTRSHTLKLTPASQYSLIQDLLPWRNLLGYVLMVEPSVWQTGGTSWGTREQLAAQALAETFKFCRNHLNCPAMDLHSDSTRLRG